MLVHNEENEDRDIKETFQSVFKPFWAGVPVVNDLLLHIKLLSDNFFITVKNVESVLKPTASPSLSWSLSQFPCFMKWLVVLLLPLGDGVLVHYKVTPMLWLSLIILIKLFQVTWHLHFFCFFFQLCFFFYSRMQGNNFSLTLFHSSTMKTTQEELTLLLVYWEV